MKILVAVGKDESLIGFRLDMMKMFVKKGHTVVACAPLENAGILKTLADNAINFENIKLNRTSKNPLADIASYVSYRRLIKRIKPDVFMAFTIKPVIYGSLAASRCGVKTVIPVVTGLGYAFDGKSLFRKALTKLTLLLYKISMKNVSVMLFQNPDNRNEFTSRKIISEDRTHIIRGSGVNMVKFPKVPLPQKISFLFIGRLNRDKGIVEYISAAKKTKLKYPELEFKILGDSDLNPSSLSAKDVDDLKNCGSISFYGKRSNVADFIAESSVVVLPSYSEGTPRSILEGMSMGRPIIVADAPGCREPIDLTENGKSMRKNGDAVMEGKNGLMIRVADENALAMAFEFFAENPERIKPMGDESFLIVEKFYDVEKVNADIFGQIIKYAPIDKINV